MSRDLIQNRRGLKEQLPNLAQGEIGYTLDEKRLYVGGLTGNTPVAMKSEFDLLKSDSEQKITLLANTKANQRDLDATNVEVDTKVSLTEFNVLQSKIDAFEIEETLGSSDSTILEVVSLRTNANSVSYPTASSRVADLENSIQTGYKKIGLIWEIGTTILADGTPSPSPTRMLSNIIELPIGSKFKISVDDGYKIAYKYYDDAGVMMGGVDYLLVNTDVNVRYRYYRFYAGKVDNAVTTPEFANKMSVHTNVGSMVDKFAELSSGLVSINPTWESGSIADTSNEDVVMTTRLRTGLIETRGLPIHCSVADGYEMMYKEYDFSVNYKGGKTYQQGSFIINSKHRYIRFIGKAVTGKELTVYHATAFKVKYNTMVQIPSIKDVIAYPELGTIINENNDLMAHVSSLSDDKFDKGTFYCIYYNDKNSVVEHPDNLTSATLVKFNVCTPSVVERFNILSPNQIIGEYIQDNHGVREPNLYVDENYVYCYVLGRVLNNSRYVVIKFDKATKQITTATEMTVDGFLSGTTMSGIITFKDGFYYTTIGKYTAGFSGKIVRSTDLIHWDTFITYPSTLVTVGYVMEISICFDNVGNIYSALRIEGVEGVEGGIYIAKCNMNGVFEYTTRVYGLSYTRPQIIVYKDKVLLFVNSLINLFSSAGEEIARSTMQVYQVDNGVPNLIKQVPYDCGIHYFSIIEYYSSLYMTFSTDRKKLNLSQSRSSICFMPLVISV